MHPVAFAFGSLVSQHLATSAIKKRLVLTERVSGIAARLHNPIRLSSDGDQVINRSPLIAACFLVLLGIPALAAAQPSRAPSPPLRVFLDCEVTGCDFNYFRTEVPFVDYVRDRQDAQLHVLARSETTGGGGEAYVLDFIGKRDLAALADTVRFSVPQGSTQDDRRKQISRALKLGLMRFVVRTADISSFNVSYTPPTALATATASAPTTDRWNYWVFRTRAGTNFSGEKTQRSVNLNGSQSANRTTESLKVRLSLNGGYNESKFTFSSGTRFANYAHSYGVSELAVKSAGPHWSLGERISISSSTFLNQKRAIRAGPAVEYDLFPYKQSSARQLTFQYSAGLSSVRYKDTTIFNKISETHPEQSLVTSLGLTQPWGSVSAVLTGASYLHDLSKNRFELFNSADVRIFKGLSVNLYLSTALIRDQLYLRRGTATDEEVLTRRRQLATSYRYFGGFGLTYTFGSIFNNIVNTRFDTPGGGTFFF